MPTRRSQGMLGLLRSHKQIASRIGNGIMKQINPPQELVARMRMGGGSAWVVPCLRMPALMLAPAGEWAARDAVLLHLHGGAYMSGGLLQSRALMMPICRAAKLPALTFSYRLSPRHPYPAQLQDAIRAYDYLTGIGYDPKRIFLVGESAGGNLALALCRKLRQQGRSMPGALALLSPWADLAQQGESYRTLRDVDATLNPEELMQYGLDFAGDASRLTDPEISPVYGDFHGFPPTQIHCGTHEILLSDSLLQEEAMQRDGVDAQLIRWEGMCHVFQAFGFEESKASIRQIGAFLQRQLRAQEMRSENE